VIEHLASIPEVLEAHATTGPGDLHCRVVARTNEHLQHVINTVLAVPGINRTTTQIALTEQLRFRVLPLVSLVIPSS
jgi:DNA-binding Lrp family transcriptional regulator